MTKMGQKKFNVIFQECRKLFAVTYMQTCRNCQLCLILNLKKILFVFCNFVFTNYLPKVAHCQALKVLSSPQKTWRKVWMVLFKPSSTGVGRLEFCAASDSSTFSEHTKPGRQKTTKWKVVRLSDCLSVTLAAREACPAGCTAFNLNTKQCNYIFASMSSQDWTSALCLLAFQVSARLLHSFPTVSMLGFGKDGDKPSQADKIMRKLKQLLPLL